MRDQFAALAAMDRFVLDVGGDQEGVAEQHGDALGQVVAVPFAEGLAQHPVAHRVGQYVDALEAAVESRRLALVAPLEKQAEGAGQGDGAVVGGLLVVPVVLDDPQIVVAWPDHRDHQHFLGRRLVAQALELLDIGKHIVRQVGEAVDVQQHLALRRFVQVVEEGLAAQFDQFLLALALAEVHRVAGGVVAQVELEWPVGHGADRVGREAIGNEQHGVTPRRCADGCRVGGGSGRTTRDKGLTAGHSCAAALCLS